MRKKVSIIEYKTVKGSLKDGVPVDVLANIMRLSETTIRRIRSAKSYKGYVSANRARYTPVKKYDDVMTTYIETPQVKWWDRFKRRRK
jgi:hypothetical protein